MTLHLVYNPASGRFCPRKLDKLVSALRDQGFDPVLLPSRMDGFIIPEEARLICVFGGDGTLRLAVKALGERAGQAVLSVFPSGTINLVARELGYASDPQRFARELKAAWIRGAATWVQSPLVRSVDTPVIACLSIGPDSMAVAAVSDRLKARIGRMAYMVAGARLIWHWPRAAIRYRAETPDGVMREACAETLFVARGRFYAGPFMLSPRAGMDGQGFELVTIEHASRWRCAAFSLALMLGLRPERLGLARVESLRAISIDPGGLPVQVDGDAVPVTGPVRLETGAVTLRFCV